MFCLEHANKIMMATKWQADKKNVYDEKTVIKIAEACYKFITEEKG